jgi:CDP-6-deoxy-D-xylo-4-hexulose-3-dehydrase
MGNEELRSKILALVAEYYERAHAHREFLPGISKVHYAGRVFDAQEMMSAASAVLDFQLTAGKYANALEDALKAHFRARRFLLVNSGSSANLLMISTLCAQTTPEPLKDGDEVITPATTFPTTLAPVLQNRLVPVLVDCEPGTLNMDAAKAMEAVGPRTRAILLPHTLGSPWHVAALKKFCREKGLYFLEDGCDAFGSTYDGKPVGSFGDMSTLSFYPAHHITMGEGGGVAINNRFLVKTALSMRDWGRDCWCEPGKDNTCGRRFDQQLGGLPCGYDHKFTYSHLGYNLKATDMQAAVGVAQLEKLPEFIEARRRNFRRLWAELEDLEEFFILPEATSGAEPSWFGFPIAVRPEAPFTRDQVLRMLESAKVATRLLFAGNVIRQPAYREVDYRVAGSLENTDFTMNQVFWIGVYPGLTPAMLGHMVEALHGVRELAAQKALLAC